jgi:hypothetical protein
MLVRTIARAWLAAAASACVAGAVMADVPGVPNAYQFGVYKICDGATQCYLLFPKAPANKVLRLTNMNCQGSTNSSSVHVVLFTGGANEAALPQFKQFLNSFWVRLPGGGGFSLNEAILTHIPANRNPKVWVQATGYDAGVYCFLSGQLINAQ